MPSAPAPAPVPNPLLGAALALVLASLSAAPAQAAGLNAYTRTDLVSDGSVPAAHLDTHLVNAWGLAFNPTGYSWVANNGTGSSTLYDGAGNPQSLVVAVPAASGAGAGNPTGIVYNGVSSDFVVTSGTRHGGSVFLFANEDGAISGWAPAVDSAHAILAVTPGADAPIYKGLAIASSASGQHLYATDFKHGAIDVYDRTFTKVTVAGGFVDPTLPAGYAPFGIQALQGVLIVTYARQVPGSGDEKDGPGLGFVDEFDTSGHLLHRIASHRNLNAPWGIALAPANFGAFSNALLIANFGDGTITGISTTTGRPLGLLRDGAGSPIRVPGLWAIQFGNGVFGQATNTLYFTAGPNGEAGGLYGSLTAVQP